MKAIWMMLVGVGIGFAVTKMAQHKHEDESGDLLLPMIPGMVATFSAERDSIMPLAQWVKQNNRDLTGNGQSAYNAMAASYNACIEFLVAAIDAGVDSERLEQLRKRLETAENTTKRFMEWYATLKADTPIGTKAYRTTSFRYGDALIKAAEVAVDDQGSKRVARSERISRLTTSLRLCKWKLWPEL